MKKKKIAIVGIGGRTGTMFARELEGGADVFGIGRENEINMIKEGKLLVQRNDANPEKFKGAVMKDSDFLENNFAPDIIFLCVKNPVGKVVKFYYGKIKEKGARLPALILPQNGFSATKDAEFALKEILGEKEAEKVKIIRMVLFNPIDGKENDSEICMNYFLPVRVGFGKISGEGDARGIADIFKGAKFEATQFFGKSVRNMEYSKLFLNLIGMSAASKGISVKEGLSDKKFFKDETVALKEYIFAIYAFGGNFVSFPHYPVKYLVFLFSRVPFCVLSLLRFRLAKIITKGRGGKPKDLGEIEYYNGEVIKLAKRAGIDAQKNKEIYNRVKEKLEQ